MIGTLKEFFNSLKPKEKIMIILSMVALGIVLIGVVLLIAFCSAPEHVHQYDCSLELVDGKFNLIGECKAEDCGNPEIFLADVDATPESTKSATCIAKGEIVYSYTYEGKVAKYTQYTDYSGHMLGGVEMDLEKTYGPGELDGITHSVKCNNIGEGSFVCDNCLESFTVAVEPGKHVIICDYKKLPTKTAQGLVDCHCQNKACSFIAYDFILNPIILAGPSKNSEIISEPTASQPGYVKYTYRVFAIMEIVIDKLKYADPTEN